MCKSLNIHIWTLTLMAAVLLVSPAWAGPLLDPATLQIGPGAGTACATKGGGCPIFSGGTLNGEVNNIQRTELSIFQNQTNAAALDNPVLLILSVPNNAIDPTALAASLSASLYAPYYSSSPTAVTITAGTSAYGITTGASGFAGLWSNNSTANDVYNFLGLSGTDGSNNWTNYSTAYQLVMGTSVNNFGIYVFSIDTTAFAGNGLLDIQVNSGPGGLLGGLPEGTFAIGYGQQSQKLYDTPFTQAGMVDRPPQVPEPSSLSLFGAALVALGLLRWRKRSFI